MAFEDYLTGVTWAPTIPDWALLGGRIFLGDGINPNLVLDGHEENTRINGCFPPLIEPTVVNAPGAGALTAGQQYIYAVIRFITLGAMIIRSDYMLSAILTSTGGDAIITFDDTYEFPPAADAGWTVAHRIYRSVVGATTLLYHVADVADASGGSPYTDTLTDAALQADIGRMAEDINTEVSRENKWLPPCRYVRTWGNRLVWAGTHPYSLGTATIGPIGSPSPSGGALNQVTINAPGVVRETDVGATIVIEDEPYLYTIGSVDVLNNTYTLTTNVENVHTACSYAIFREYNTIYITNVLGTGNIEAYTHPDNYLVDDERSGNQITGIGANARSLYIFQRNRVSLLYQANRTFAQGFNGGWQLDELPGFPGCVSHATIADRFGSAIFWYAGEEAVWMVTAGATQAQKMSGPLDNLFFNDVDHSYDDFCHGVFDPVRQMYHLWLFENDSVTANGLRVPQLMVTYDLQRNQWYLGELAASISGIVTLSGVHTAVIGIPGGVAKLEGAQAYDGYNVRSTFLAADTINADGAIIAAGDLPIDGVGLAGIPIHVCHYDANDTLVNVERKIIKENTGDTYTLWADWETTPAIGDEYLIGAIRWHLEVTDVNLLPSWQSLKLAASEINVLANPSDTAESSRLTVTASGMRTKAAASYKQTVDMHDREIFRFRGAERAIHSRSAVIKVEGNTAEEITIKALEITQGQPETQE